MANVLSRVTLALKRLLSKKCKVIATYYLDRVPAFPIKAGNVIYLNEELQPEQDFDPVDGRRSWFYPIIGLLYIHRETKTAFFSTGVYDDTLMRNMEGALTVLTNFPVVLNHGDVAIRAVLANGCLVGPGFASVIQNNIRRLMIGLESPDYRVDLNIIGNIDHDLMRAYAEKYMPKEGLRLSP